MVLLRFMSAGVRKARVPTTVHCNHLLKA
jgi:aconitate hydratase